jgi:hypothetical protein
LSNRVGAGPCRFADALSQHCITVPENVGRTLPIERLPILVTDLRVLAHFRCGIRGMPKLKQIKAVSWSIFTPRYGLLFTLR